MSQRFIILDRDTVPEWLGRGLQSHRTGVRFLSVSPTIRGVMLTKHFDNLGFSVKAVANEYYVEFEVFEIAGKIGGGEKEGERIYAPMDGYPELKHAPVYAHGTVKWDGCSDWHFDEQDRCCLHGCHRKDLIALGGIMAACWDWTAELLDNFDGE